MLDTPHATGHEERGNLLNRIVARRHAIAIPYRVLINRDFALLWTGQVASDLGSVIFNTTLLLWVGVVLARGATWGPLAVSGVLVAQTLPQVVLRPLAGVLVDRWDVRRTMLRTDAWRAVLVALLTPMILLGAPTIWRLAAVYAAVLLVSVGSQFFNPALFTLIGDLVPETDQPRASALSETTWNVASVVGPPLAAPLLFFAGVEWALVLNAASFAVSYLTLRAIRMRAPEAHVTHDSERAARFIAELHEGIVFAVRNRVVCTVTIALCVAMLGAGVLHALEIFFVTENLHAAPRSMALLVPRSAPDRSSARGSLDTSRRAWAWGVPSCSRCLAWGWR